MQKNIVSLSVIAVITAILFTVSSCESGGNHTPTICFRITTDSVSYQSSYLTLPRDSTFNLFIAASKTGPDGILKTFKITKSVNGGADTTLMDANVTTQYYSQFYTYKAGDSGTVERYTFTIGNSENLYKSIEFVDTVR